jgi:hypothetical protein
MTSDGGKGGIRSVIQKYSDSYGLIPLARAVMGTFV